MKKICGVICEFNPLHEGHIFLLNEAKKLGDALVCVMSGNFVQRGECAVFDKYTRAEDALDAGADLVLELPFPWSAAPAEFFARAGLTVAVHAGVTDLVFGSESGNVAALSKCADLYDSETFREALESFYKEETGYASARYEAAKKVAPELAEVFNSSNDSLAAEYIRQSARIGFNCTFHAIKRTSCRSATQIRADIISKIDRTARGGCDVAFPDKLFEYERACFSLGGYSGTSFDHASGILNRLKKCADVCSDGEDLFKRAATKKYTDARLRRAALFSVAGIGEAEISSLPEFTVLLGANGTGRQILKDVTGIEVVTKPADATCAQFRAEAYAERLYRLCLGRSVPFNEFLKKSPVIY